MIYEKLAAYYDRFVDYNLNDLYLKLIKKHFNKGNIIDLGCGTGPLAILLAKNNFFVTATDISESMLEIAYNNSVNEEVKISFSIHDILEPLNNIYDIITMSSDVINYLDDKQKVLKAFEYVNEAMNDDSIFVFDFLEVSYMTNLIGHHDVIELEDSVLYWDVVKTDKTLQIKHIVTIDNVEETHLQTTFSKIEYLELLKKSHLKVVNEVILEDRIVYVCKVK